MFAILILHTLILHSGDNIAILPNPTVVMIPSATGTVSEKTMMETFLFCLLYTCFNLQVMVWYKMDLVIQYNMPDKNIDILLIAIYCDILQYIATFIAFKVVSIRLLHHKYDWTSCNHEYLV